MSSPAPGEQPSRFQMLRSMFEQASALPSEQREAFVRQSAADDAMVNELLGLLEAGDAAPTHEMRENVRLALAAATAETMPARIGGYRVLSRIGQGGMGVVYRAERSDLRNPVAIKVAQARLGLDPAEVMLRFDLERRALAAMSHRCIAKVFDAGATDEGQPYFVMELVDGESLTSFCDQRRLTVPERLRLFQQICGAVQHAHQKGVVHRDLKPDNVLVVDEGGTAVAKILDFGIAKATNPDQFEQPRGVTEKLSHLGTLAYMSPEQVEGRSAAVDARSDIYSLGVMLYELLTGEQPFPRELLDRMQQHEGLPRVLEMLSSRDPDKPSLRVARPMGGDSAAPQRGATTTGLRRSLVGDLDWIVLKAMAKEPERRYAAATELGADLQRHLDHQPVSAGPPSARYRASKFVRRNRPWLVPACGLIVLLFAFGVEQWRGVRRDLANQAFSAGRIAFQTGRWQEAMGAFDEALANGYANQTEILCNQVECLEARELHDESLALLDRIPKATSRAGEARRLMLIGAIGQDRLQDPQRGMAEMREAMVLHEAAVAAGEPGLRAGDLGFLRAMLAEDLDAMIDALRVGIAGDPFHRSSNTQLPGLLLLAGRVDESIGASRVLIARWPKDPVAALLLTIAQGLTAGPQQGNARDAEDADADADQDVDQVYELIQTVTSILRVEVEAAIVDAWKSGTGQPLGPRNPLTLMSPIMRLSKAISGFRDADAGSRFGWYFRRLPPAVIVAWTPLLQVLRGVQLNNILSLVKRPQSLLAKLEAVGERNLDVAFLLLRVLLRMQATGDKEAVLADLDLAARHRGPLGAMPEMRRYIAILRARNLLTLMYDNRTDMVRHDSFRARLVDVIRGARANPGMTVGESTFLAEYCVICHDLALGRDVLEESLRTHPDDVTVLIALGAMGRLMDDPVMIRRWFGQALLVNPGLSNAAKLREDIERADQQAASKR